ncbi:MAG: 2-oxoacid:acceptor oxidoreductase subunit alpha [Chloroflexi bacterium]|nr:2-oxoacid:acceptor oxidoreductase subunit alpha [Chloroflexota bacterium]
MVNEVKLNDLSITFATINGSGSATSNNTILRAIFNMGIPVSARNIFPSNIQGMPTWYSMRISKDGYFGRVERDDILIAMNPESYRKDILNLNPGGLLLHNQTIKPGELDKSITAYAMPVDDLVKSCGFSSNLSVYLANMVYAGILAYLIGIDIEKIASALDHHFGGKRSAIDPNLCAVKTSFSWAQENIGNKFHLQLEPMKGNEKKIMLDGNTAGALGALYGGLQFAAWYPITPATSLAESLNEYIPTLRTDPETGNTSCVVVQAEDELAAIGMVVGAGWAGLRSMTSTSGPGMCLMSEFMGLAYFAEIPLVVWDVQRVGPSTGMPTHTSQADLSFSYFLSHGDKDFVILLPANINECFNFGWLALDIAEELQSPVIVLSDLELGMNTWITEQLKYPDKPMNRGKVLWEKDLEQFSKKFGQEWGRYLDVEGDGITYRTLPGNMDEKAPYFTRGTSHDDYARYSEDPQNWEKNLLRLKKKFEKALEIVPRPEIILNNSKEAIISYGSTDMAIAEVIHTLEKEARNLDYIKINAIPFNDEVRQFIDEHEKIFVVENNRDGQMKQILGIVYPEQAGKFISISRSDGMALSAEWISGKILSTTAGDK